MFSLSYAIPINPDQAEPALTREQVWQGLVMKANDAKLFVPTITTCDVVERGDSELLRNIVFKGDSFQERVTFHAPVQVHFARIGGGGGFIENTISESEHGLWLTFTFGLTFPGTAAGSPEERAKGEDMRHIYIAAVAATLDKVRELARAGELAEAA